MPYFIASIMAVTTAMVIMFTRYEADDSAITSEIEKMKNMIMIVDSYVNTYINTGGLLSSINFEVLEDSGILVVGSTITPADAGGIETTMSFPNDKVVWHIIPNKNDISSYNLLINMQNNPTLMSKGNFSENFIGTQLCEQMLFGTTFRETTGFDDTASDFTSSGGNSGDGLLVCIVSK